MLWFGQNVQMLVEGISMIFKNQDRAMQATEYV